MKEIKFRAWDYFHKKMITTEDDLELLNGAYDRFYADIFTFTDDCTEHPLMQFTGRKDCNGVDIYDGDIICQNGMNVPVVWNDKWACWELNFNIHSVEDGELQNLDFSDLCDRAFVVGNIYQNPELIPKAE